MQSYLLKDEFVSDVNTTQRLVSVRTSRGCRSAEKLARLKLLEEKINVSIVGKIVSDIDGKRWYTFSW